jgi:hypothetical protein
MRVAPFPENYHRTNFALARFHLLQMLRFHLEAGAASEREIAELEREPTSRMSERERAVRRWRELEAEARAERAVENMREMREAIREFNNHAEACGRNDMRIRF